MTEVPPEPEVEQPDEDRHSPDTEEVVPEPEVDIDAEQRRADQGPAF
jgi:hypothetical protein